MHRLHPTGQFDNYAADYRHIEARPLSAAMGAEIVGVQIATMSGEQFTEVRDALFRHKMIYFRGQDTLSHADHEAFSLRFGPFAEDAYTQGMPSHRNVHPLIKEADDRSEMVFGEGWHTDSPFLPELPSITILCSVQIPPLGGDTTFANAALAFRMLSETYQRMLAGLRTHFSLRDVLHSVYEAVEVREHWETNMVVAWDNRLYVHQAYNDYQGYRLETCRTTVSGEKPI